MRIRLLIRSVIRSLSVANCGLLASIALFDVSTACAQSATPTPTASQAPVQPFPSLLEDLNQNGVLEVFAYGDSITRGVGDFTRPGADVETVNFPSGEAGYPLRVEGFLGISVDNFGDPGEQFTQFGLNRMISISVSRRPDLVLFTEGSNDALNRVDSRQFVRNAQELININSALGIRTVLLTIPPPCCGHAGEVPFVAAYNEGLRDLARINDLELADINHAYRNICGNSDCYLLNLPEGLHPNSEGYDVSGEVVAATLLGIDILQPDGPALFSQAVGIPVTNVQTVPDALPASPTPAPSPASGV